MKKRPNEKKVLPERTAKRRNLGKPNEATNELEDVSAVSPAESQQNQSEQFATPQKPSRLANAPGRSDKEDMDADVSDEEDKDAEEVSDEKVEDPAEDLDDEDIKFDDEIDNDGSDDDAGYDDANNETPTKAEAAAAGVSVKLLNIANSLESYFTRRLLVPCALGPKKNTKSRATLTDEERKKRAKLLKAVELKTIIAKDLLTKLNEKHCKGIPKAAQVVFCYFRFLFLEQQPLCCCDTQAANSNDCDRLIRMANIVRKRIMEESSNEENDEYKENEENYRMVEATLQTYTLSAQLMEMEKIFEADESIQMKSELMRKSLPPSVLNCVSLYRLILTGGIIPDFMWISTVNGKRFVHVILETKRDKCDTVYEHEDFGKICLSLRAALKYIMKHVTVDSNNASQIGVYGILQAELNVWILLLQPKFEQDGSFSFKISISDTISLYASNDDDGSKNVGLQCDPVKTLDKYLMSIAVAVRSQAAICKTCSRLPSDTKPSTGKHGRAKSTFQFLDPDLVCRTIELFSQLADVDSVDDLKKNLFGTTETHYNITESWTELFPSSKIPSINKCLEMDDLFVKKAFKNMSILVFGVAPVDSSTLQSMLATDSATDFYF